jgi:hypothetical protein
LYSNRELLKKHPFKSKTTFVQKKNKQSKIGTFQKSQGANKSPGQGFSSSETRT